MLVVWSVKIAHKVHSGWISVSGAVQTMALKALGPSLVFQLHCVLVCHQRQKCWARGCIWEKGVWEVYAKQLFILCDLYVSELCETVVAVCVAEIGNEYHNDIGNEYDCVNLGAIYPLSISTRMEEGTVQDFTQWTKVVFETLHNYSDETKGLAEFLRGGGIYFPYGLAVMPQDWLNCCCITVHQNNSRIMYLFWFPWGLPVK